MAMLDACRIGVIRRAPEEEAAPLGTAAAPQGSLKVTVQTVETPPDAMWDQITERGPVRWS
jgi:hypothetical protein